MTTTEVLELIEDPRRSRIDTTHVEAKRAERGLPTRLWEVEQALGVSGATARRLLAQLRAEGLVEATTSKLRSTETRYRLRTGRETRGQCNSWLRCSV